MVAMDSGEGALAGSSIDTEGNRKGKEGRVVRKGIGAEKKPARHYPGRLRDGLPFYYVCCCRTLRSADNVKSHRIPF